MYGYYVSKLFKKNHVISNKKGVGWGVVGVVGGGGTITKDDILTLFSLPLIQIICYSLLYHFFYVYQNNKIIMSGSWQWEIVTVNYCQQGAVNFLYGHVQEGN